MKRIWAFLAGMLLTALLQGCAHPISMNPDLSTLKGDSTAIINKSVGYYISDADKAREVTTAGGGGDNIRYFPYRDLEPGLYKVLSEVFKDVNRVLSPRDASALTSRGISLLFTPEITTVSSSDGMLAWPPTQFTVNLVCTVTDALGQPVQVVRVSGFGQASFDEIKSNVSLAAVRASNNALALLIKALGESQQLRN